MIVFVTKGGRSQMRTFKRTVINLEKKEIEMNKVFVAFTKSAYFIIIMLLCLRMQIY